MFSTFPPAADISSYGSILAAASLLGGGYLLHKNLDLMLQKRTKPLSAAAAAIVQASLTGNLPSLAEEVPAVSGLCGGELLDTINAIDTLHTSFEDIDTMDDAEIASLNDDVTELVAVRFELCTFSNYFCISTHVAFVAFVAFVFIVFLFFFFFFVLFVVLFSLYTFSSVSFSGCRCDCRRKIGKLES